MKLSPAALLHHSRTEGGRRAIRYTATSGFGVVTTQVLLAFFLHVLDWKGLPANFVAVTLTAFPAFLLNKYWVWGKRGKAHFRREVLPFWLFTVAGLILSSITVAIVVAATKDPNNPDLVNGNPYAVQFANIVGFGILWVLKYMFLDKIMFGSEHHTPYDEDEELELAEGLQDEYEAKLDAVQHAAADDAAPAES